MMGFKGTLYVGMTNDLERRVYEHKQGLLEGFTKKYHCIYLVYFEEGGDVMGAIVREKEIKGWKRSKKLELIYRMNPDLNDLAKEETDPSLRSG